MRLAKLSVLGSQVVSEGVNDNGVDPNDQSVWDWSPARWRIGTVTATTALAHRRTPTPLTSASI